MIYSDDNDLHPPHDKSQQMKKELSPEEALYRAAALLSLIHISEPTRR